MDEHSYLVTCVYANARSLDEGPVEHTHVAHSELPLDKFVEGIKAQNTRAHKLVRVVWVRPEIAALREVTEAKIRLWDQLRKLEEILGKDLDNTKLIDEFCIGTTSPVTLDQYDLLCEYMDGLRENNGLPSVDYTEDKYEA